MATDLFKVPQTKRPLEDRSGMEVWSPSKKKKIKETFLNFCDIVLAYTQYSSVRSQEMRHGNNRSPLDSTGSTADSYSSDVNYSWDDDQYPPSARDAMGGSPNTNEVVADDTSFDVVTCFCGKPYMGRPMIECSVCFNWLHLSCVHLRKSNIPDTYICEACKRSPPHHKSNSAKRRTQQRKLQMAHAKEKAKASNVSPPSGSVSVGPYTGVTMKSSYTPATSGVMRPSFTPISSSGVGQYTPRSQSNDATPPYDHAIVTTPPSSHDVSQMSHNALINTPESHARSHGVTPVYGENTRYYASPVLQNGSAVVNNNIIDTRKVNVSTWKPPIHFEHRNDARK